MQKLISIIVPTYNRSHCVSDAICSVLAQSYLEWELIIVDDGSSDNTVAVVNKYSDPRIRYIRHSTNQGAIAAKSTGLDHARGEWIGILDSDDTLHPDALMLCMGVVKTYTTQSEEKVLGTVLCNCISSQDGSYTGKGIATNGTVSYEDFLCGRVHGEFWGIFSRNVLGSQRFDTRITGGFESTLWLKLYRDSTTYYIHQGLRNYTVAATDDQVSSIRNVISHAEKCAYGYGLLLSDHGSVITTHCPLRYTYLLKRKAFFEVISGNRGQGIHDSWRVLRMSKSIKDAVFFLAIGLLPSGLLTRLVVYWKDR
ncbi:MAG: glycosyltransferase [Anaerolineae bacterium]|nr:glycosyltransferase [Anaerolineae bacterium]